MERTFGLNGNEVVDYGMRSNMELNNFIRRVRYSVFTRDSKDEITGLSRVEEQRTSRMARGVESLTPPSPIAFI